MKANEYNLIVQCVDTGVAVGYMRAFKHTDNPSEEELCDAIASAVMNEISEWFSFDDPVNLCQ